MEVRKLRDSYIYFGSSLALVLMNFFFLDYLNQKSITLILIFFVIFLGLPHGALDTLLARQYKLYSNLLGFICFNLLYLFIILFFFFLWTKIPVTALSFFLFISIFHFSEDWKSELALSHRLILATAIVSSVILFQPVSIKSIFYMLTNSDSVDLIILFFNYLNFFIIPATALILFLNYKKPYVILNIVTISFTSFFLNPLFYFLSYFCFFHSVKNYRDTTRIFNLETSKIKSKILIMNLLLTFLIYILIFNFYLKDPIEEKLIKIIFIGLASLTIPHMLLKAVIEKKK